MYAHDNTGVADDTANWADLPPGEHVDAAVESFRMLADPTRLRLLWLLCGAEYDVSELAQAVDAARPAVSQHLAKLRIAGLVATRRDGRRAVYRARGGHVRRLLAESLEAAGHVVTGEPDHE
jgi:DNA-binding transcriptional ArsR family regulator